MSHHSFGAVLLAGGKGNRMNATTPKQYLLINEKPMLYHSLHILEQSFVEKIILVVGRGEEDWVRKEIVEKYDIHKVVDIVGGGRERSHSVYNGLLALTGVDYVMIHDGARPCIDIPMLERIRKEVLACGACIVGMPVKDTIKIVNGDKVVVDTPDREKVWMVQTPQAFEYHLIRSAYVEYIKNEERFVTDDAMVLELMTNHKVRIMEGGYYNIKVTTPEDLKIASEYLLNINNGTNVDIDGKRDMD